MHYQSHFIIDGPASFDDQDIDLPVRFNLPNTVPETDAYGSATWDLSLRWCSIGRLAHSVDFQLPVFRGENSISLEEAERFDQLFYPPKRLGFPRFARPSSLKESIESCGGRLDQTNESTWEICLPRGNSQGVFDFVIFGCGALAFLGGGILICGVVGLSFAVLPWISLMATARSQKLYCDGSQIMYQQDSFWRRQTVSVNISDVKSVGHRQQERSKEGIGVHQVTAELISGRCITLLTNARSLIIAAGIVKRLAIVIQSQKVD